MRLTRSPSSLRRSGNHPALVDSGSDMMEHTVPDIPSLLFVVSNDYGELTNALHLIRGQPFAPLVMLPRRLLDLNADGLGCPSRGYGSASDVIAAIDDAQPDVVFLFSAYLYALHGLLGAGGLERIVHHVHDRGVPCVTSDPFLGLATRPDPDLVSDSHPRKAWLLEHFARVSGLLTDVPHLYLVRPPATARVPAYAFHNPESRLAPAARRDRDDWLFLLSSEDYAGQVARHGKAAFDRALHDLLGQTVSNGCRPVLLAPPPCIASVTARRPAVEPLLTPGFCGRQRFGRVLADAAYVFYWNIFSNSVVLRLAGRRPVFFFDTGHLARAMPPLERVGRTWYYADAPLPMVDMGRPLNGAELAALAERQAADLAPARARFIGSPGPPAMVEHLLRGGPRR